MALENMGHIFTEETGQRMAEALDRQNTLLAGIAAGNAGADYIDASFAALLDGTNTTAVFEAWWPLSAGEGVTKYQRLERFARMLAKAWRKKTYTVRNYHESVSGDDTGTPLDDLADGRSAAPLVTDSSPATDDWSEEDPMTWYIRANAKSLIDGTMEVLAVEGEESFDLSGEIAPVYVFSMALAVKEWTDNTYIYTSWRTHAGSGYKPMAGDVASDGTMRALSWHPAFYSGRTSTGAMTSGAYLLPMPWTSATAALPLARKQTAYDGLWNDCDTQFALMAWRLRHWTLSNSGHAQGCNSYNYQYTLALAETGAKRLLLTKAQAANFVEGSGICLGERGSNTGSDRNTDYNHNILTIAKIASITNVTIEGTEYGALNLDISSTIDTTTTMLVSTMPWPSGSTEKLQGHSDGSIGSLTNGKYPYRVAGMEMEIGSYCEELDPLWQCSIVDDDHWRYEVYACRDGSKQASSITGDYEKIGQFDLPNKSQWTWNYIRELNEMTAEAQMPTKFGGSGSTYLRAAFCSGSAGGLRSPWRFGYLYAGSYCGLPCASGYLSPGASLWLGVPRLAGSGKKRGEWPGA